MQQGEEPADWSRRYQLNLERLASGDLDRVTRVVVDLGQREREGRLTAGEARQLAKARELLQLLDGG
jgi:CarD family transcriptional regulator